MRRTPKGRSPEFWPPLLHSRWIHPGIVTLGAWMIVGPATIGDRSPALTWSDLGAGAVLVALGLSVAPHRAWVPWATALVGLWLLCAPFVFWPSSVAAWANDI